MAKSKAEQTAARLAAPRGPLVRPVADDEMLSTGCTLLNMALSGRPNVGVPKGTYLYIVGDSGSSKTWFTFNLFAEAARNKHFADYRFVFDNAENGALMDVERYFGPAVLPRLVPPAVAGKGKTPVYSRTVQQFYWHVESAVRRGPCIYVLDSMDALQADADDEKFEAELKHYETGEGKVPGSMGMAKAKDNSRNICRIANHTLRANGSVLVVVSQTRDKIGSPFPMKTRGGGHALKFFAHLEMWTSVRREITARARGRDRPIGDVVGIDVRKNRVCGWEGKIEVPFLKGVGIDDVGGCVQYLIDEKHWSRSGKDGPVSAPEFGFEGDPERLVAKIQAAADEWELSQLVAKVWREIQEEITPRRKPRYTN